MNSLIHVLSNETYCPIRHTKGLKLIYSLLASTGKSTKWLIRDDRARLF